MESFSLTPIPLCVDLDGTLIRSDLLVESFFLLLKHRPLCVFLLPLWLWRGKAVLKYEIARRVQPDYTLLPYDAAFLDWLRAEHARGRSLWLCTASHRLLAEPLAGHLGLFERVLASDDGLNLSGVRKRERLVAALGERGYDYAGNAEIDLEVWRHARHAISVDLPARLRPELARVATIEREFAPRPAGLKVYAQALRLHQWVKNLLIFLPLLLSHQLDARAIVASLTAFLAFGLCASSVYLLNDLLDLPSDRRHPRKCQRPFASGTLGLVRGALLIPALLALAGLLCLGLPAEFFSMLTLYYALTVAYSVKLKEFVLIDVIALAGLYTSRILAGAAAVGLHNSFWLLAFSVFLFLSLALVKRYAELREMLHRGRERASGRDYSTHDLALLQTLGIAAAYNSVLVLALYINSDTSRQLYARPELIWLLCPVLLYWVSRVWLKTHRDEMHDDPVVFAVRDRASRWLLLAAGLIVLAAV